ncbi:MCE family protein [Actinoplanes sp. NPDC049265]|uniref:MCE family protein n=1 Tax=Actinoplanes sp. NPDC049265 TaxID=3363902 RepID=UPI00371B0B3C
MKKLGAAFLVAAVLLMYGAFHLEDLLRLFGGATYHAAFRDASGLAEGNEVRVAGVKVGKVTAVGLARAANQTYVRVSFAVEDDDVRLGDRTSATIRIKTVLGQKYLALAPAGDGRLPGDGEIPLDRTASPFDVVQAVTGLADRFQQIDTKQLATAFDTLSTAFADTPDSVRTSLDGLSRLTRTLSDRDAQLRELLKHAHGVSGVLAERDDEFRELIADGDLLLAEVIKRRDAIHQLLVTTTALAGQLSGLVKDNRARLAPALTELRAALAVLQRNRDNLSDTIATFAPFLDAFTNVLGNGRWFDSYLDGLIQPFQPGAVK